MLNAMEQEDRYGFNVYPRRDRVLVRGEGAFVWDDQGRRYIDCAGGHGVASVGHAHPRVAEAVAAQARRLVTCPGTLYNDQRAGLLEALARVAPPGLGRAFLCNSGTESVEAALKFARFTTGRTDFVCAMKGFHGRTLGALSATHNPEYRRDFAPLVPGFTFVPFNRLERMADAVTPATAAVLLEVVQGEGGVHPAEPGYLRGVKALCKERGALLIVDEVQTGFGRTGRMFAVEHHDVVPDLMCVAKAMAGGLPMGAVLCSDRIRAPVGRHGSTFGGNPLACAAARTVLDILEEEGLAEQARHKGALLLETLGRASPRRVRQIRGLGLMAGLELREKVKPWLLALLDRGVLALPAGSTVLRLLPPLTIGRDALEEATDIILDLLDGETPSHPET